MHAERTCARQVIHVTLLLVASALVLAGPAHLAGAQPAPSNELTTDAAQYLPGALVTVTGSGWTCSFDGFSVSVTLFQGDTPIDSVFPSVSAGSFTQTFAAPTAVGSYRVEASDQACGSRSTTFEVVAALATTTSAATTTTAMATTSSDTPSTSVALLPEAGSSSSAICVAAAIVMVVGVGLVVVARRRTSG